ncbi:Sec-independent protein translocase subunit TatA [Dermatophilaceae bacterium Soc4.6]|uniref:Sec-independent protein translocase subunit TatA n=1 Tax=Lapillicoccus sp. TaxID=1909287 RepID=UPI00326242E6
MLKDLAQPSHLLILAVLIVVLFGWKKLPDAARSVGRSMRIFKSEMGEMKNDGKDSKPSPAASETVSGQVTPAATTPPAAQAPPVATPVATPADAPVDAGVTPQPHDTTAR